MACEDAVAHYNRALTALRLLEGINPELSCKLLAQAEAAWGTLEQAEAVQQRFVRAAILHAPSVLARYWRAPLSAARAMVRGRATFATFHRLTCSTSSF